MRTKTSRTPRSRRQAFTLIEILLVLALLALLATAVVPRIGQVFRVSVQSSVRQFSSLVRYTYDQAILTGRVHRIVLDLDRQSWSVEIAAPGVLPQESAAETKKKEDSSETKEASDDGFKSVKARSIDRLPTGVSLLEVASWRNNFSPVRSGTFYVYAYPNGLIDESALRLSETGKENVQSFLVRVQPLTGRTKTEVKTR